MYGCRTPLLTLMIAAGLASAASAQADPPRVIRFLADAGLVQVGGNEELLTLSLKEEVAYDPAGAWRLAQGASWIYGEQDGEERSNTIAAGLRADRELGPRVSAYGAVGYFRAPFAGVSRRFDEGLGLTLKALMAPRDSLGLEAGMSLVQERSTSGVGDDFVAGRVAGRYRHMLGDRAYLGLDAAFQPNLERSADYRLDAEAILAAPLAAGVALRLSYLVRYANEPPPGFEQTDTLLTSGVQLEL